MKGFTVAAAFAALAGGASAHHAHRHAHQALFEKRGLNDTGICVPACTTYYTTIYGEPTLVPKPAPTSSSFSNTTSIKTSAPATTTAVSTPKTTAPVTVPTPIIQTCPTPGTYTFPATTVVVTETTTVCGASTTLVPKGTHTLGGVTTVVTTATTVTCPVATTSTLPNGDVTSIITTTAYVCPSAGTYTIAPVTTTVTAEETVVVVPVVTTYCPGTYTAPAVVTTVTETNVIVVCPFTSPAATTTAVATATPVVSVPVASTPASTSSTPVSTSTPSLGGGKQWAMTYTPYDSAGLCKTADAVDADIKKIAAGGFSSIRVYSTDCDTLPNVGAACRKYGLKMIIGVFVGSPGCDNGNPQVKDQISAIKAWAQWDLVELCVVGNEALFNGYCTPSQLKSLITQVRGVLRDGGCSAPITTSDTVNGWQGEGVADTICSAVDVVGANVHAYFNGAIQPGGAGDFVKGQLKIVTDLCGGKQGYVLETGWPHSGNCIGSSCPGVGEQASAIKSIQDSLGSTSVFFSWTDDPWKQPGDCNCERSWGCGTLFSS